MKPLKPQLSMGETTKGGNDELPNLKTLRRSSLLPTHAPISREVHEVPAIVDQEVIYASSLTCVCMRANRVGITVCSAGKALKSQRKSHRFEPNLWGFRGLCISPGSLETCARRLLFVIILISEDFPTLDLHAWQYIGSVKKVKQAEAGPTGQFGWHITFQ